MGRKPAVCTMGGAIIRRFALFPLMLLMLLLLPANMVAQTEASSSKYIATYESSTQTLTFKEYAGETLPSNSVVVKDKMTVENMNTKLGNGTIVHIVFDKSFSTYTPTSLSRFFKDLTKLETITGLEYLNTKNVTDMRYMFFNCSSLTSLDVTHFNTANVTDMSHMFFYCSSLTLLDVTHFNTAKVKDMTCMFRGCSSLTSLDVTKFNTVNVTNMSYMFTGCSALLSLDVTNFNTANVTNMSSMFDNCSSLTSLDVTHFNTANVTNMSYMFTGCSALLSLDVTNFNTANVTNMSSMFDNCSSLTSLDVTHFNTANVTNMSYMFTGCSALLSLDVTNFNTANVTNMSSMFDNCSSLTSLDVTHFNTANVTNMSYMFTGCSKLTSLYLTNFNTENVTNMYQMFYNCKNLSSLDLSNFNTEKVTDMTYMFNNCSALTTIYASDKFVTDKVTDNGSKMFYGCKKLKGYDDSKIDYNYANCGTDGYFTPGCAYAEFDNATGTLTFRYKGVKPEGAYDLNEGRNLPDWNNLGTNVKKVVFDASFASARPTNCYGWFKDFTNLTTIEGFEYLNTENVTNMTGVFNGCSALTSLDLTNFNTAKVTDMKLLFANCSALESLDLSMFNTENVTSMPSMFNGATNLKTLNVSNFNTEKVNNMGHMFANCPNLTSLDLSSFNTKGVEYVDNIFKNCSNLTTIYASENFAFGSGLKNGADMFLGCDKLKGFIEYNKNTDTDKNNSEFANYMTGYFTKLVGKNGEEKIGAVGEILTAENLTLNDDKDFVAYEPFAAKAASYCRTINAGTTWATLCLPFEVSLANQNFRAFKLLSADDVTETVELEEIEGSIAAGTPVIIKMKDGATKLSFSEADKEIANEVKTAETADANYKLQGLYTQKMFSKDTDNNCYIVKGDKLMNPAKLLGETSTAHVGSKPFRAYMADNSSAPAAGARMFSISVGGSTTAIEQLESTADSKAEYYDLQGRRLQDLQKGINIVKRGGKTMKVIIK